MNKSKAFGPWSWRFRSFFDNIIITRLIYPSLFTFTYHLWSCSRWGNPCSPRRSLSGQCPRHACRGDRSTDDVRSFLLRSFLVLVLLSASWCKIVWKGKVDKMRFSNQDRHSQFIDRQTTNNTALHCTALRYQTASASWLTGPAVIVFNVFYLPVLHPNIT